MYYAEWCCCLLPLLLILLLVLTPLTMINEDDQIRFPIHNYNRTLFPCCVWCVYRGNLCGVAIVHRHQLRSYRQLVHLPRLDTDNKNSSRSMRKRRCAHIEILMAATTDSQQQYNNQLKAKGKY